MRYKFRKYIREIKTAWKRWKLRNRKEEIFAKVFADIDKNLREVCMLEVGGFRPSDDPKSSWFGNVLVAKEEEVWPEWKGKPLAPLVQFNLTEAKFVPERLRQFKLITVFIDEEDLPFDRPMGEGWLVRGYESFEGLVPLKRPIAEFEIKPFPIRWEAATKEGPDFSLAGKFTDLSEFDLFEETEEMYLKRYCSSERSKLGGYPATIQDELDFGMENFVFQISTEEKAHFMWGDAGIGYFGLDKNGQWLFEWQCF